MTLGRKLTLINTTVTTAGTVPYTRQRINKRFDRIKLRLLYTDNAGTSPTLDITVKNGDTENGTYGVIPVNSTQTLDRVTTGTASLVEADYTIAVGNYLPWWFATAIYGGTPNYNVLLELWYE